MRIVGTALGVLLAAGVAFAQQPSSGAGQMPDSGKQTRTDKAKDEMKGKSFKAEVVSTDATAKTITVKRMDSTSTSTSGSNEMTLSVDPKLESSLSSFNAGDHVKVMYKTDSSGKEIATKIDREDTRPATDQPPKP